MSLNFPLLENQKKNVKLPEVLASSIVARSRLFSIESLHLRFSNGAERVFERLPQRIGRAVIVCALTEDNQILLVREYMAGIHKYELALPKGRVESSEDLAEAANRELMEEVGFAARKLSHLKELTVAPGQMGYSVHAYLATDLYEQSMPGDEPEPLEVVPWPLTELDALLQSAEISEARSLATLMLVQSHIQQRKAIADGR